MFTTANMYGLSKIKQKEWGRERGAARLIYENGHRQRKDWKPHTPQASKEYMSLTENVQENPIL